MSRTIAAVLALCAAVSHSAVVAHPSSDYWRYNRETIQRGMQAVMMCNGLFTSNRTLEQVFKQELAYLNSPIGTAAGGDYQVDRTRRAVAVGAPGYVPVMRAAFREGIGCVILAPDQTVDSIDQLPSLDLPYPLADPARIPWPNGDLLSKAGPPGAVNPKALSAASRWAFERKSPTQVTLSLLVIHKGRIVHERYAAGVDMTTRTRTWSTAKSITATLIGMLVDQGRLSLDKPLGVEWLPRVPIAESDPRGAITLRNLLNMSSGLIPVDDDNLEYATGSGLAYWAGYSSVEGALRRPLFRKPGTYWNYENYDTLLAVHAMKQVLGEQAYREFPRRALLDRIGMRNTLISTDRFGDFILSSQVYTNARDLGRFGLLYLHDGLWDGQRLLSKEWIQFVRTPAPAANNTGHEYGGHWWLVPDDRNDVPKDAYTTVGNRGQFVIVVPSHELVIVRRGLDFGAQGFDPWDLTHEVLKAF